MFFPGAQSVYVYNSLQDFYDDVNRVRPVALNRFQVRYNNIPGQEKPLQPLKVTYIGAYAQDEWTVSDKIKVIGGVRMDIPTFGATGFANANANALTFRDEGGAPIQYDSGKLPDASPLWSPRVGFNVDLSENRTTQMRGGTGIFTGKPLFVWISNQIGNTGVLTGFSEVFGGTDRAAVQPRSECLQAHQCHWRAGRELRAGPDRSGLQVPAGVAQQRRHRPAPAVGASAARRNSSTTATSMAFTTSTPTCRRHRAPSSAPTAARAGSARPAAPTAPPAAASTASIQIRATTSRTPR